MTLIYDDERFGDRYEVEVDPLFNFLSAKRYVDGIGTDPLFYEFLSDINPFHRHHIEQLLWKQSHSQHHKS